MLQEYKRKRDFKITPEPSGAKKGGERKAKGGKGLSFVIQKHAAAKIQPKKHGSAKKHV
jgi:bifunctional non-homologous end joining protein LigD